MGVIHLVFGPQGAGKSTYSRALSENGKATHFSIDEWMVRLYGPDLPQPMNFGWIMARVKRCEAQIWATANAVARNGGNVVLDLGFMKAASRAEFKGMAQQCGLECQLHYLSAPRDIRRSRVLTRNVEKGDTFSLEVTPMMFDFMEDQFERPSDEELACAVVVETHLAV